jgi:cytochrome c-type biogenesis protein CcmF
MHVNTLIELIPLGGILLILGALVAMWPDVALEEAGAWGYIRAAGSVATAVLLGFMLAAGTGMAYAAPPPARAPVTTGSPAGAPPAPYPPAEPALSLQP